MVEYGIGYCEDKIDSFIHMFHHIMFVVFCIVSITKSILINQIFRGHQ